MPRAGLAKRAVRRARIFAITKGFLGRRKNCYSIAVRAAEKAMQRMYIGRKLKKRDMRRLWVQRVSIASRELGTNYSTLMSGLRKADVALNRKVLSEIAVHEPRSFEALAKLSLREHAESKKGLALLLKR